ncbi:MAG: hypothetical protein GW911_04755 [Armatimonadetes bacterium]|nr:hypothetical protein [Armatimonadota bacterium]NCO93285.1 hypothetical protein [Armatimonadota bacterium]NCP29123.1 hypothetical protein [Armatimonadota bacterium]NCQ31358.1 hypothetical protein [Armatimonadota bacterium]NDK11349.1 hypothetical protein [Armatimonadota bacterium]
MQTAHWRKALVGLALLSLLLGGRPVSACSVPVFQYALERWPADPYEVVVFHRGPLSEQDQATAKWLKERDVYAESGANYLLRTIDLDASPDESAEKLWKAQATEKLPWLVALYPRVSRIPVPAWAGELSLAAAKALVDSPLRQALAKQLLDGATTVWILIDCEEQKKNEAAEQLLRETLKHMESVIQLPDPEMGDEYEEALAAEREGLKVSFPLKRLSRTDPAEKVLLDLLLHSEEDLLTFKEPIVFPVFGRGRALFALVGKGINEENLQDACGFVCGACSCEIKQMNPGVDLLLSTNWDAALSAKYAAAQGFVVIAPPDEAKAEAK